MSKAKDFLNKFLKEKELIKSNGIPPQNGRISMYNNDYRILTKADSKICILQDTHGNRIALPSEKILKMLDEGLAQSPDVIKKASVPGASKPIAASPKTGANPRAFPIGTVHNGRKKVGEGVWVSISSGQTHSDHSGDQQKDFSTTQSAAQVKQFMTRIKGKTDSKDHGEIQVRVEEVIKIKNQIGTLKKIAKEHTSTGDKATATQATEAVKQKTADYQKAFSSLQDTIKSSAKAKKGK
jgi:hypothetical protein